MKTKVFILMASLALAGLTSCNDDPEQVSPEVSEEVSLLVATSMATNTYGFNALIGESVTLQKNATGSVGGRKSVCDYTDSGSEEVSSPAESEITFNYSYSYDVSVNCSSIQIPTSLSVDFTYSGSFDSQKLSWSHNGNGDFEITLDANQNLVYNGTYDRSGEYDFKERENINGSGSVEITISNLTVDPETESIVSGSGTFEVEVNRATKSYTLSGSIVFNGNGTATLNLNGSQVTFNLTTGSINS